MPKTFTGRINRIDRIIPAIRKKVITKKAFIQLPIRVNEPSGYRIIIPTLQIIETGLLIVIITAVTEWIEFGRTGRIAGRHRSGYVSVSTVFVRYDFGPDRIVHGNDVPLQILLKQEVVVYPFGIGGFPVPHPDWSACLAVQIDEQTNTTESGIYVLGNDL